MYINFSSRKFKKDHYQRIHKLKDDKRKTEKKKFYEVLADCIEIGLTKLEPKRREKPKPEAVPDNYPEFPEEFQPVRKRVVPFGIKEDG